MRTILFLAAFALTTSATATTMHPRHTRVDSGSAAVRELNQRSLQQASAAGTMTPPANAMTPNMPAASPAMPQPDAGQQAPQSAPMPADPAAPAPGEGTMPPAPPQ